MSKINVLIIDDEEYFRKASSKMLRSAGYNVHEAENGQQGIQKMAEASFDVILCDLKMPDINGIEVLERSKEIRYDATFIMITAYGTIDSAVQAIRKGAYNYASKPLKKDEIITVVEKAYERTKLIRENRLLRREADARYSFANIIGKSQQIREVQKIIKSIADAKTTVLITGESGTGKELFAKAIHFNSIRRDNPFITINCGAIPQHLLESELFGHKKGAFTGATETKKGLFEEADSGTILLDEIGELPPQFQVKLLRAIEQKEIRRIGETKSISLDARIIAATNRNLQKDVQSGRFREDLFYRLNVLPLHIAPLRERKGDIPLLVHHFIAKHSGENGRQVKCVSQQAMDSLMRCPWKGNVRELENIIERCVILSGGRSTIEEHDLPPSIRDAKSITAEAIKSRLSIAAYTRNFVEEYQGRYTEKELAKMLGITPKSLWEKRKKWNLPRQTIANGPLHQTLPSGEDQPPEAPAPKTTKRELPSHGGYAIHY